MYSSLCSRFKTKAGISFVANSTVQRLLENNANHLKKLLLPGSLLPSVLVSAFGVCKHFSTLGKLILPDIALHHIVTTMFL